MRRERDAVQELARRRVGDAERAFAVADVDEFCRRVETHVVRVVEARELRGWRIGGSIERAKGAVVAIGEIETVRLPEHERARGLVQSGDGVQPLEPGDIEHFARVVAERRYDEPLRGGIAREVVEPAFHARQRNRVREPQRFRVGGARCDPSGERSGDGEKEIAALHAHFSP